MIWIRLLQLYWIDAKKNLHKIRKVIEGGLKLEDNSGIIVTDRQTDRQTEREILILI